MDQCAWTTKCIIFFMICCVCVIQYLWKDLRLCTDIKCKQFRCLLTDGVAYVVTETATSQVNSAMNIYTSIRMIKKLEI